MWMDTENKVTQEEVISPLSHDVEGAFSRHGERPSEEKKNPLWLDTLLVVLFVTFLYFVDFILFAGSGNLEVFKNSIFPVAEVSVILFIIALIVVLIITPFHTKKMAKYAVASVLTFCCIYILFRQFFQYHQEFSIGAYMMPLSVFVGIILSCIAFVIFQQEKLLYRVLLVVAAGVLFFNVYFTYYSKNSENHGFEETHNTQIASDNTDEKFIYFLLPNFVSSAYLNSIDDKNASETNDLIQGFYQKNKFKVFSKAYTPEYTYLENMIRSFNPESDKSSKQHTMTTKKLDRYWRFYNLRNEYVFLQNNELYDYFKEHDYQLSAYKSRDIEMCRKRYDYNVDRCIEKVNKPTDLDHTNIPLSTKVGVLTMEWLSSIFSSNNLFNIYNFLHRFNFDSLPLGGTNFNNLYVLNSIKTFDILAENIRQDKGKQAYFVFVDLPSNMYIYDEYCRIKDQKEWQSMTDMPWENNSNNNKRRDAYLQQTRCLIGQLNRFTEVLKENGLADKTTVVVQGTSGVSDFRKNTEHDNAIDRFIYDRMVNMAIYAPQKIAEKKADTSPDERFCATNQILAEFLNPDKKCGEDLTGFHEKTRESLAVRLKELTANAKDDKTKIFDEWYQNWSESADNDEFNTDFLAKAQDAENAKDDENTDTMEAVEFPTEDIEEDFGIDDLPPMPKNKDTKSK